MMEEKWGNQTMPFKSHYYQLDQLYRWVEDQQRKSSVVWNTALKLQNFVKYSRDKASHMTQNFVMVRAKLKTGEWFLFDLLIHGSD